MIERESIENYPELIAFLSANDKLELLRANKKLNLKTLYQVRQKTPLDLVASHPAIYIIAAFGTSGQMQSFLSHHFEKQPLSQSLILKLVLYAVRNLNHPVYNLFYNEYGLRTVYDVLADEIIAKNKPIIIRNHLTDLLDAAVMAGNEGVAEFVLSKDTTGYIALGVQGNTPLKLTPLYYAALGNHMMLFDRLLSISTVKEQFERSYTTFCLFIDAPSPELKQRFLSLRPTSHASSVFVPGYFGAKKIEDGLSGKRRATDAENMQETASVSDTESLSYSISRYPSSIYLSQYGSDEDSQSQIGMTIDDDEIGSPFSSASQKTS